eukprot:jgi/Botrbrau1/16511/Bobra.0142s0105.1
MCKQGLGPGSNRLSARVGSVLSWSFWIRSRVKCGTASVPGSSVAQGTCPESAQQGY